MIEVNRVTKSKKYKASFEGHINLLKEFKICRTTSLNSQTLSAQVSIQGSFGREK